MAQLEFYEGARRLFVYELREGRVRIGRADSCDLALPSETVSRVHCTVSGEAEGFVVVDRSTHGTAVNGERLTGRRVLADGDVLSIGHYRATFIAARRATDGPWVPTARVLPAYEQILAVDQDQVAVIRAEIRFLRGPLEGQTFPIRQARTTIGGPGSDIPLDEPTWPRVAACVQVSRSRPMIGPGERTCLLGGQPVTAITPMLPGEEAVLGEHAFTVDTRTHEQPPSELDRFGDLVATSPAMKRVLGFLRRIAAASEPALITGPSGTGKELAARAIHEQGPRCEGPFVALNSAGFNRELIASQLFGHEKGSFTGATARADGAFQHADGGTLFLDEIGELDLELQAQLLRALESGEVRRLGAATAEYPDVRVIAATHRDLPAMVRAGTFRQDLYFRLAILKQQIPPLRDRMEDVPLLARTLLAKVRPDAQLTPGALAALMRYPWPGNVRELRNVLTRAVVMSEDPRIRAGDLQFEGDELAEEGAAVAPTVNEAAEDEAFKLERQILIDALEQGGSERGAAKVLKVARSSLLYRLEKHGLRKTGGPES